MIKNSNKRKGDEKIVSKDLMIRSSDKNNIKIEFKNVI